MGPIGYAVAYRSLHRPGGPPSEASSRPVRSWVGALARITLLVLLLVLSIVALVDGDWWFGIPLALVAVVVGMTTFVGGGAVDAVPRPPQAESDRRTPEA
jgi:hypothetical protein